MERVDRNYFENYYLNKPVLNNKQEVVDFVSSLIPDVNCKAGVLAQNLNHYKFFVNKISERVGEDLRHRFVYINNPDEQLRAAHRIYSLIIKLYGWHFDAGRKFDDWMEFELYHNKNYKIKIIEVNDGIL